MRLLRKLVLFFTVGALVGCASTPIPATGPLFKKETLVLPEYSTLYLFRPPQQAESHYWPEVYLDQTKVVGLKDGGYTSILIKPGKYKITTKTDDPEGRKSETSGDITIEPDSEYYLKLDSEYKYPPKYSGYSEAYTSSGGAAGSLVGELLGANEGRRTQEYGLIYKRWVLLSPQEGLAEIQYRRYVEPYVKQISP